MYSIQNSKAMNIEEDSLKQVKSVELSKAELLPFIKASLPLVSAGTPLWNGIFLCSYELEDGKLPKVYISTNGSFFWIKSSVIITK
jgi:hypothetical protein